MDIFKRYTPAELKDARADFERVDPALQHMIAESNDDFFAKFETPVAATNIDEPRPLTKAEQTELDVELNRQMFGGKYAPQSGTGCKALDDLAKANEEAGLQKLLAPALRERNTLAGMIESAIAKAVRTALAKGSSSPSINRETIPVRSQPVREGIHPAMSAIAHDDSDIGRFVKAWIDGDTATQRKIASELAAA